MIDEMEKVLGNLLKENQPQDYIRILEEENERIENEYKNKVDEIGKLTNNWNELEDYLNGQIQRSWEIEEQCYETILDKMKEIKEKKH